MGQYLYQRIALMLLFTQFVCTAASATGHGTHWPTNGGGGWNPHTQPPAGSPGARPGDNPSQGPTGPNGGPQNSGRNQPSSSRPKPDDKRMQELNQMLDTLDESERERIKKLPKDQRERAICDAVEAKKIADADKEQKRIERERRAEVEKLCRERMIADTKGALEVTRATIESFQESKQAYRELLSKIESDHQRGMEWSQAQQAPLTAAAIARTERTTAIHELFCFPGETLINVWDTSSNQIRQQRIDSIRIGDTVVSCDVSTSGGSCEFGKVKTVNQRVANELVSFTFNSVDEPLRATLEHPIYSVDKEVYQDASAFNIGDQVFGLTEGMSNEILTITSKEFVTQDTTVYNLEVEGNNNYYACGVLVHNCRIGQAATEEAKEALPAMLERLKLGSPIAIPVLSMEEVDRMRNLVHQRLHPNQAGPSGASEGAGSSSVGDSTGESTAKSETPVAQSPSRAPKVGQPNSIHEQVDPATGEVVSRTFYDKNGRPFGRQDFDHEHGGMQPHEHKMGFDAKGRPIVPKSTDEVPPGYDTTPTGK
jgi:hypothetical protein